MKLCMCAISNAKCELCWARETLGLAKSLEQQLEESNALAVFAKGVSVDKRIEYWTKARQGR